LFTTDIYESYGILYINNDFSQLTYGVNKKESKGCYCWSAEDGLMISAPTTTVNGILNLKK
jgi:hypothetical protein